MAKINLTPISSMQGLDNDQAIRRIESYLFTLNEQLRYELTHIDEDNMAVNNTPARQVSASSGESSGSTQVDGQTIDLNDNPLIRQLKSRLAELQTSQKQALDAINNNTQSITDALKEINNVKNRTWSYPSHRHSVQIDGSGNLTMGGPTANPTYPNIADTAYVQGLVSAARNGVNLSGAWSGNVFTVTASNGKTLEEAFSAGTGTGNQTAGGQYAISAFDSAHKAYGYVNATRVGSTRLFTFNVDATEAYNAGWAAAKAMITRSGNVIKGPSATPDEQEDLFTITVGGSINSIRNVAPNTYFAEGYAYAYIDGNQVASRYMSKSQTFG